MNKRIVFIAVMAAALAGMGIALFFLGKKPEIASNAGQPGEEYVYSAGSLASVTVRNGRSEYTLKNADKPAIDGFEDIAMDAYSLRRVLNLSSRLVSRGLVTEEAADLAVFGLDPPLAECTLLSAGGAAAVLLIGSQAPDGGSSYVKIAESPGIYLAASYDTGVFLKGPLDFADTGITPPAAETRAGELPFEKIVLGGQVRRGEEITIVNTGGSGAVFSGGPYRITSPVDAALSMDKGFPPLEALFGLSADRVAATIAGKGDLGPYGLADPWSTVTVSGTAADSSTAFSLRASKPDSAGMAYIFREGSPLIYEAAASKLPWLAISWFDMMEKLIILPFIDSIASVELKTPERSVSFFLSGEGDDLRVKAGAADIDVKIFRSYYQTLIGAMYDEYSGASAASLPPPFLDITYRYRDSGRSADTVSFHHASSRRVLTSLNRGKPYFTLLAYTDKVLADLDLVLAGERVRPYL
jgi:hypothetical protein